MPAESYNFFIDILLNTIRYVAQSLDPSSLNTPAFGWSNYRAEADYISSFMLTLPKKDVLLHGCIILSKCTSPETQVSQINHRCQI